MKWSNMLDQYVKKYTIINQIQTYDEIGGTYIDYVDGPVIELADSFDNSTEMKIAQKQGVTAVYSFIAKSNVILPYHTILRREDGVTLRITLNTEDKKTPESSPLDARYYEAELFTIPKE